MVVSSDMWRDDLVGVTILDYRLTKLLRNGSVADVYEASGPDGGKVAIKILSNASQAARVRFQREMQVTRALKNSEYLAQYVTHGEVDDGMMFLVLGYVDGINLRDGLNYRSKLEPIPACQTMIQICQAVGSLHNNGLVHGDIRPENLLLDRANLVKLVDLGMVRDVQGLMKLTEHVDLDGESLMADAESLQGSPQYLSPEQIKIKLGRSGDLEKVDTPSDVYSLGLIFYQMLSGRVRFPFKENPADPTERLGLYYRQRLGGGAEQVPAILGIDSSLHSIVESTLRLDPSERPKDAMLLCFQIERYLSADEDSLDFDQEKTIAADEDQVHQFIAEHGGVRPEDDGLFERFIGDRLEGGEDNAETAPASHDDELEALIAEAEAAVSKPRPSPTVPAQTPPPVAPRPISVAARVQEATPARVDAGETSGEFAPEPTTRMPASNLKASPGLPTASAVRPPSPRKAIVPQPAESKPAAEASAESAEVGQAKYRTQTSLKALQLTKAKKPIQWAFWIELVILLGLMGFMVYYLIFRW